MGRVSGSAGARRGPARASLGRVGSVLAPWPCQPGDGFHLAQLHLRALSPLTHPTFTELSPPSAPGLLLAFLLSFGIFFSCCFTLCLIIAPHFSLYLKSRIMPVSCVHFRNEIYGNTCHWMNCFSLASYFLMITNCLPVQETISACSPNFLAFNCNQKLEVLDCPYLWSEVPGFFHQGRAILRVGKRVGNPRSLDFKAQIMVFGPNKKGI